MGGPLLISRRPVKNEEADPPHSERELTLSDAFELNPGPLGPSWPTHPADLGT